MLLEAKNNLLVNCISICLIDASAKALFEQDKAADRYRAERLLTIHTPTALALGFMSLFAPSPSEALLYHPDGNPEEAQLF